MSLYQGFTAAAQTVAAVHSRRAALAAEALVAGQRAEDARRRHVEGVRQVLFEAAQVVRAAGEALASREPAAAEAGRYLALRARPILDPAAGGVADADLPELQDKTFREGHARARQTIEAQARSRLSPERAQAVERLTWLDQAAPRLRAYAAWREASAVATGWTRRIDGWDKSTARNVLVGLGWGYAATLVTGWVLGAVWDPLHGMAAVAGVGLMVANVRQAVTCKATAARVASVLRAGGEDLPGGAESVTLYRRRDALGEELAGLGVDVRALREDAGGHAAQLTREREALWAGLFGGSMPGTAGGIAPPDGFPGPTAGAPHAPAAPGPRGAPAGNAPRPPRQAHDQAADHWAGAGGPGTPPGIFDFGPPVSPTEEPPPPQRLAGA